MYNTSLFLPAGNFKLRFLSCFYCPASFFNPASTFFKALFMASPSKLPCINVSFPRRCNAYPKKLQILTQGNMLKRCFGVQVIDMVHLYYGHGSFILPA